MIRAVNVKCPLCGDKKTFYLDSEKYENWNGGELIQNIFPEISPDDQEMLISGVCPKCWPQFISDYG